VAKQTLPDGNWNSSTNPNLTPFTITSGFVAGVNTLDFQVTFPDGFDGLRVRPMTLTVSAVPEPATRVLASVGFPLLMTTKRLSTHYTSVGRSRST
jgi:hypothetical protein